MSTTGPADRDAPEQTVHVDLDRCVAAGQCVRWAPEVFDQDDDDGTVVLLDGAPPAAMSDDVRDAVRSCPARAITFTERGAG